MKKKLSLIMAMSISLCSIQSLLLTANAEEETDNYKAIVRVYDSETNKPVEDVNVKFIQYEYLDSLFGKFVGETVSDSWNTSDDNPHYVNVEPDSNADVNNDGFWYSGVVIDNIPDGYSYKGHNFYNSVGLYIPFDADGVCTYNIPLEHSPAVESYEFPLQDKITYSFNIFRSKSEEYIEGVKVKLYELKSFAPSIDEYFVKNSIVEWTYKKGDTFELPINIEYLKETKSYILEFEDLPKNYVCKNQHTLCTLDDNNEICEKKEKANIYCFNIDVDKYNEIKKSSEMPAMNIYLLTEEEANNPVTTARYHLYWESLMAASTSTITTVVADITGDANCDNNVNIADATSIMQHIGNRDKYPLTEQGLINADCCNVGDGVTGLDALAIQKLEAKQIKTLPLNE